MNGAKSLSDDLHEEVGGDFRVQGDGCREVTGGLDRLNGDVLRVDLNLGGERDGDLLCGDAAEQLAGLGDLGSDFDGEPSMISLAATASSRVATALARRARFMASIWAAAPLDQAKARPCGNR